MNAETRAKEIVRSLCEPLDRDRPYLETPMRKVMTEVIATAIRQAENDKLEEAARLCDGVTEELKPGRRQSHASPYFAALIRSLKSKD